VPVEVESFGVARFIRMRALGPDVRRVLWFTLAYLFIACPYALLSGNYEFVLYIAVVLVIIPVIGLVHSRVTLTTSLLWAFSLWGLFHMLGGLVPVPESLPIHGENHVLYSLWILPGRLKYDHLVHAYGFGITAWLCWQVLDRLLARARQTPGEATFPTLGLLVLSVAGGMGFGALNEVIEFAATLLVPETNVGGYINTGWDLVANLVGGVIAAVCIRLRAAS
jgi:uncharacterized membrane protein YjdF